MHVQERPEDEEDFVERELEKTRGHLKAWGRILGCIGKWAPSLVQEML